MFYRGFCFTDVLFVNWLRFRGIEVSSGSVFAIVRFDRGPKSWKCEKSNWRYLRMSFIESN